MKKQEHLLNRAPFGTWKCKYCNFIGHTRSELQKHKKFEHPNFFKQGGGIPWNKGKTVETDLRVKNGVLHLKEAYDSGKIKPSWLGRKHTEEQKKKLSEIQRKNDVKLVSRKTRPYVKLDGSIVKLDSSYEVIVAKILDKYAIEWVRPKEPLFWIDSNNIKRRYFPDFFIPSSNVYLDPKNSYLFEKQKEKIEWIHSHTSNVFFLRKEDLSEETILKIVKYNNGRMAEWLKATVC